MRPNIQKWADQLKILAASSSGQSLHSIDGWALCGHAVVLEVEDAETALETVKVVANYAGVALQIIPPTELVTQFSHWGASLTDQVPKIVYLTPGAWLGGASIESFLEENDLSCTDAELCKQFRNQLIDALQNATERTPFVVVTGAPSFNALHVSLRKMDLFDRRIQIAPLSKDELAEEFIAAVGQDRLGETFLGHLPRLGALLKYEYPDRRRRRLAQQALSRLSWSEQRKVELPDLLRFVGYGTAERAPPEISKELRWRNAVHEAGHALLAQLDSREQLPPTYCSILSGTDSHGIVIPNVESIEVTTLDTTLRDAEYRIRVRLAGRAAEQLLLGVDDLSASGSSEDLKRASNSARQMLGEWGMPTKGKSPGTISQNLAILVDEPTPSEAHHIESQVRTFLEEQYQATLDLLETHKNYLLAVAEDLSNKMVLFEEDFWELRNRHQPKELV